MKAAVRLATVACCALWSADALGQHSRDGYLDAGGVRLHYRALGEGPDTVVVLHGGPSRIGSVYEDFRPLAQGRVLIFYDQRGGGRSQLVRDTALLNWRRHVDDLESLRRHFRLERLTLIGNSWGSSLATLYASAHPERIERMLLFPMRLERNPARPDGWAPPPSRVDSAGRSRMAALLATWASERDPSRVCHEYWRLAMQDFVYDLSRLPAVKADQCDEPAEALRVTWWAWNATYRSLGDFDWRPRLRQITAPVLLMKGLNTTMAPSWTEAWARELQNGRLLWVDNAGYAIWIDQPAVFFKAADDFLRGQWPKDAKVYLAASSPTVTAEIQQLHAEIDRLYRAGDAAGIGWLLTDSVVISAIELPDLHGRETVRSILAGFFTANRVSAYTLDLVELDVAGTMAFGRGVFLWSSGPIGSASESRRGRFAAVYRRDATGGWRLHRLIENLLPPTSP